MKAVQHYWDKLFVSHWNIGFCNIPIEQIIINKINKIEIKWLKHNFNDRFFADPFLIRLKNYPINVLVEDYRYNEGYGRISLLKINEDYEIGEYKTVLNTNSHISYPYPVNKDLLKDRIYLLPESSLSGNLSLYCFDKNSELIEFVQSCISEPLLDATPIFYDNIWWIFSTKRGNRSNSDLFIYYSDEIDGPYTSHKKNPVKRNLLTSRPAGDFIIVDGFMYRPTMDCSGRYGKSINVNKIIELSKEGFKEELYLNISLKNETEYTSGFHTINCLDGLLVVDGLRRDFTPLRKVYYQLKLYIRKLLKMINVHFHK